MKKKGQYRLNKLKNINFSSKKNRLILDLAVLFLILAVVGMVVVLQPGILGAPRGQFTYVTSSQNYNLTLAIGGGQISSQNYNLALMTEPVSNKLTSTNYVIELGVYQVPQAPPLPPACVQNWNCGEWSSCQPDNTQTRSCVDLNNCGNDTGKPDETQSCVYQPPGPVCGNGVCEAGENYTICPQDCPPPVCAPDWQCTDWSSCLPNNTQMRTCSDLNSCGNDTGKPGETQSCAYQPTKANLTITTTPVNGEIFLNGSALGTAPQSMLLDPGTYNVSFGAVADYITPASQLVTLSAGDHKTVTGVYTPLFPANISQVQLMNASGGLQSIFAPGNAVVISLNITNAGADKDLYVIYSARNPNQEPLPPVYQGVHIETSLAVNRTFVLPVNAIPGTWKIKFWVMNDIPSNGGIVIGRPGEVNFTVITSS